MRQAAVEIGKDVEIGQGEVAARQPLIVLVRYVLDDGGHREVWLIGSAGPRGGWAVMPTRKARYVIDVIVDAKSTTRRCYRGIVSGTLDRSRFTLLFHTPNNAQEFLDIVHHCLWLLHRGEVAALSMSLEPY
jgi:hypothetical protein